MDYDEILVKRGSSLVKIKLDDIKYFEALENYVTLHTKDDMFTIHYTMNAIENQLPSKIFVRVHPSYIVNKSIIEEINENSLDLDVGGNLKNLPIDNSFRNFLLEGISLI